LVEIDESLYPEEWKSFGQKSPTRVTLPLWALIMAVALLVALAACLRPDSLQSSSEETKVQVVVSDKEN